MGAHGSRDRRLGRTVSSAKAGRLPLRCEFGDALARRRNAGKIFARKLGRDEEVAAEGASAVSGMPNSQYLADQACEANQIESGAAQRSDLVE